MLDVFSRWYKDRFSDPHAVTLTILLVFGFSVVFFFGSLLAPLLAAIVIAYLLDWPVSSLQRWGVNRTGAAIIVLLAFVGFTVLALLGLVPTVVKQGANFIRELPYMLNQTQGYLLTLPEKYPEMVDAEMVSTLVDNVRDKLISSGEAIVSFSLGSLINIAALLVYCILVPLLVFFMLKDKTELTQSVTRFLPENRQLATQVWVEMNSQIINYIRGKVVEILIVGSVSYVAFAVLDLRYSALLAVLVGLSVLIPFIGAAAVTVPVALVGVFQWGFTSEFLYLMIAYGVIQALDGNVLVPVLFSEAVNLHPVAIIVAVLVFGGVWGFWGIFFAIPLATLVKAVVNAWPSDKAKAAESLASAE
ncbi:AI-2E family transporter [Motilimonas cestriensis]|uniref:AI-2E family transporter n=1 Tax=Motilimonas cestriensis TaxID=2742685 RepID=A0ABS8W3B7_9GAMM|nr:AI-2E family transporter [Motilimonas cestriensis]MCE2593414.1 AI-2E family transporter [Motilimonas cestriensis]